MSIRLMSQVWELDLDHPQQSVLLAMADHADDDGTNCYPSIPRIAWKTGYSKRQVQRVVSELKSTGVLVQVAMAFRGKPTEYVIDVEAAAKKPPFVPEVKLTSRMRYAVIEAFDSVCQYCHEVGDEALGPDGQPWHVDRIEPASRGGMYTVRNVTLSCGTCNRKKGAKLAPKGMIGVPSLADKGAIGGTVVVPFTTLKGAIAPPEMAPEPSVEPSVEPSQNHGDSFSEKARTQTRCPKCEIPLLDQPHGGYCIGCEVMYA